MYGGKIRSADMAKEGGQRAEAVAEMLRIAEASPERSSP